MALTWVLVVSGHIPGGRVKAAVMGQGRAALARALLRRFDRAAVRAQLHDVVTWKVRDPNIGPDEQRAMWDLVRAQG